MSFFSVKLEDGDALSRVLVEMQLKAQSLDRVMPSIAQMLLSAVSDVVEMEGPGWPELAPATLAKRRKKGVEAKMLRDTGVMMMSLEGTYGPDYADAKFWAPYAKYHINGWGVPKRNPLDIEPVKAGLMEDISELLLSGLA